ncbi:MAG: hypothetical protein CMN74_06060, partial [Sphingorhabdus sp.]|nr:hypothetical protein [Sphingorhabdus sp.]
MTRPLAIISIFLLAACSGQPDNETLAKAEAEQGAMQADNGRIDCALDGAETFSRECTTDRISGPDRELLIIQHPDGNINTNNLLSVDLEKFNKSLLIDATKKFPEKQGVSSGAIE